MRKYVNPSTKKKNVQVLLLILNKLSINIKIFIYSVGSFQSCCLICI